MPGLGNTQKDAGCGQLSKRRVSPNAGTRQAKACRLEGMGHKEVPEHEKPLRA